MHREGVFLIVAGALLGAFLLLGVNTISFFGHNCYFIGPMSFERPNCIPQQLIVMAWLAAAGLIILGVYWLTAEGSPNDSQRANISDLSTAGSVRIDAPLNRAYDRAKWQALVDFDPDIARVEQILRPYGRKYVDQFAAGFLVLNDKAYIPNIIQKVIETARQDAAQAKAAAAQAKVAEERLEKRFFDSAYVLTFAKENFDFLVSRPYGNVAILKNGAVLLEQASGQISKYPNARALRDAANDNESWFDMTEEAKVNFVRRIKHQIPTT